jgi:formimidoylglutamate deiminase
MHDERTPHVARYVYERCLEGGAQASGAKIGKLAPGFRCDFIVLDTGGESDPDAALSRAVFRSGSWHLNASVAGGEVRG